MKKILLATALILTANISYACEKHKNHEPRINFFAKLDKNTDGSVSQSEWQASSEEHFNRIDTNGDKKITKEEMSANREKMHKEMENKKNKKPDIKNKN